jgi:hypothetical protein
MLESFLLEDKYGLVEQLIVGRKQVDWQVHPWTGKGKVESFLLEDKYGLVEKLIVGRKQVGWQVHPWEGKGKAKNIFIVGKVRTG